MTQTVLILQEVFVSILLELLPFGRHFSGTMGKVVLCIEVVAVVGVIYLLNIGEASL